MEKKGEAIKGVRAGGKGAQEFLRIVKETAHRKEAVDREPRDPCVTDVGEGEGWTVTQAFYSRLSTITCLIRHHYQR